MEKFEVYRGKHMMKCGFYSVAIHSSFSASSRRPTQRQAVMFSLPWDSGAIWSNGVSDRMPEISKLSIETNTIMKNVGPISPSILYVCRNIYIYIMGFGDSVSKNHLEDHLSNLSS